MTFQARVRLVVAAIPVFILGLLFAITPTLTAQVRSATITGLVTDPTGAVIPGADVVVTETATSVSYPSKTDKVGLYTVPYLAAGDYTVARSRSQVSRSSPPNDLHLASFSSVGKERTGSN